MIIIIYVSSFYYRLKLYSSITTIYSTIYSTSYPNYPFDYPFDYLSGLSIATAHYDYLSACLSMNQGDMQSCVSTCTSEELDYALFTASAELCLVVESRHINSVERLTTYFKRIFHGKPSRH